MATIPAGSPSLADTDEEEVDLNKLIVQNPDSTYAVKVTEDVPDLGIARGDLLIVDRELEPKAQSIVLVERDAFYAIKRFSQVGASLRLVSGQRKHTKDREHIWGVVTHSLKTFV